VKAKGLVTCAECDDFPCEKYEGFFDWDSFVTHKVCGPNIKKIKKVGLKKWLQEQVNKRAILENLLFYYNEGRSRNLYCTAVALMLVDLIKKAVSQAEQMILNSNIEIADTKAKAKIVKSVIQELVSKADINLKLRKKQK
jgi:hypothetical protein